MAGDATQPRLGPLGVRSPAWPSVRDVAWHRDLAVAWQAFCLSRAVVWGAGLAAIAIWGVSRGREVFDPTGVTRPYGAVGDLLVAPGARWDATWYLAIAHEGYDDGARTAFFPLYPLLIRAGDLVVSPVLAALAISCACFVAALAVVHRLAVLEVGDEAARLAVLGMALFPGALWFSAAYSESLFLLASVGAVLAARTRHWAWAGVLGAGAAATRSAGVLVVVALGLLWWETRRPHPSSSGRARDLAWLALVPAGLLAYCAGLSALGLPFDAPFRAQEVWQRSFTGPLGGIRDGVVAAWDGAVRLADAGPGRWAATSGRGDPLAVGRHDLALLATLIVALVMLAGVLRRLPLAHGAYAAVALGLALSYPVASQPLMSLPRFVAVLYPLFLWLGGWLAQGPRWRARAVLGTSAAGLGACSMLFSTWHWVA